ncbi:hypothetical protein E2C01_042831 [Portunus trituberculatus]|uniref:Uncharacterized protein n=1 Tax=Portunus trituberculatus TaxID=210409 RepID=A0A5B7FNL2_PORTR|nr:hypothetical protein [Portunus trituberculatus]
MRFCRGEVVLYRLKINSKTANVAELRKILGFDIHVMCVGKTDINSGLVHTGRFAQRGWKRAVAFSMIAYGIVHTHSGLETWRFPNRRGCKIFLAIVRFTSVSRYTQTYYIVHTGRCTAQFEGTELHYWLYASQ